MTSSFSFFCITPLSNNYSTECWGAFAWRFEAECSNPDLKRGVRSRVPWMKRMREIESRKLWSVAFNCRKTIRDGDICVNKVNPPKGEREREGEKERQRDRERESAGRESRAIVRETPAKRDHLLVQSSILFG